MDKRIRDLASIIWNYHKLNHLLEKADAILVLCSHDERVVERAVDLYREDWAPLVIFSGGLGAITRNLWTEPEAARLAIAAGVPKDKVIIETRSSNTGENIIYTKQLVADMGLGLQKFIVVQKPYMERRSFATFRKWWPEKQVIVTSPQISFDDYLANYANSALSPNEVVSIMVGDLQRIRVYPARGYQIDQNVPSDVIAAYDELVAKGFTKYLIQ